MTTSNRPDFVPDDGERIELKSSGRPTSRFSFVLIAMGTIILVLTEIWFLAGAMIWAVTGLLDLPAMIVALLGTIVFVPVLWASWQTITLAVAQEPEAGQH